MFFSRGTDASAEVWAISLKFCTMLDVGPKTVFSRSGLPCPKIPNYEHEHLKNINITTNANYKKHYKPDRLEVK